MQSELKRSRLNMEKDLTSRLKCYKQVFIERDSTYNPDKPKGTSQKFYRDFCSLKNSKDSIQNIKESLSQERWISILSQFSLKVASLEGSGAAKEWIEEDLKYMKANKDDLPELDSGELYKHTVERWTGEVYESIMRSVAIDFVEGHHPPCKL